MRYPAIVTKEGEHILAEFIDCPGCQTFTEKGGRDIQEEAAEALEGWLESRLESGDAPERPTDKARAPRRPKGGAIIWVRVPAKLAAKLMLRWARVDAGLSQGDVAKRLGTSSAMISKWESAKTNLTIETFDKLAKAIGMLGDFTLEPLTEVESGAAARVAAHSRKVLLKSTEAWHPTVNVQDAPPKKRAGQKGHAHRRA